MIAHINILTRARQLALLIFVAVTLIVGRNSAFAAPPAKALIELEAHTEWSAVIGAWKDLRAAWVTSTALCDDAACVGRQLLRFEEHVEWKAVNPKWQSRRPAWVEECKSVKSDAQAGSLLLELEQNMGWSAVDKDWKGIRDGWITRVKGS